MSFLLSLQETSLARYVQEDPWGYPLVLSCHAVGMALLAGVVLMISFRVLGFGRIVSLQYLRRLTGIAYAGLALNLCSGLMLFAGDAVAHFENNAFRIKIILLLAGLGLFAVLSRRIYSAPAGNGGPAEPAPDESRSTRVIAGLAVVVWMGVIIAGRLIAYTGETVPGFLGS